ncbi:39564_t:CDS:1, partial [Gigaspora margarita]
MESTKTYLIGTCYLCSRCLYCNKDTLLKTCECIKTQVPNRKNRTKEVPWAFKLNYRENFSTKQLVLLETQKEICNYNINFSSDFQFSLCSSCNAKWYRAKSSEITNKRKYKKKPSLDDDTFIDNNLSTNYDNNSYDITDSNYGVPIHKYETNKSQE